jgi:hypothetical protein
VERIRIGFFDTENTETGGRQTEATEQYIKTPRANHPELEPNFAAVAARRFDYLLGERPEGETVTGRPTFSVER